MNVVVSANSVEMVFKTTNRVDTSLLTPALHSLPSHPLTPIGCI